MPRHRFQLLSGFNRPHGIVDKAQVRRQHFIHTHFIYNLTSVSSTDERSMEFLPCRIGFGFREGQKDKQTTVHSFQAPRLLELDKPYCIPTRSLTPPVACCKRLRHTSPIDAGYDASYWNGWILQIQGPVEHFSSHSIVVKRTTLLSKWKLPRPSKCHGSDDTLAQT